MGQKRIFFSVSALNWYGNDYISFDGLPSNARINCVGYNFGRQALEAIVTSDQYPDVKPGHDIPVLDGLVEVTNVKLPKG